MKSEDLKKIKNDSAAKVSKIKRVMNTSDH